MNSPLPTTTSRHKGAELKRTRSVMRNIAQTHNRSAFLSSLSAVAAVALTSCGLPEGEAISGSRRYPEPDAACNPYTGVCTTPLPVPEVPYSNSGGINPTAWQQFTQFIGGAHVKISGSYDRSGWLIAHGANDADDRYLYTGSTNLTVLTDSYSGVLTVAKGSGLGSRSSNVSIPKNIPQNGTCQTNAGTLDTTDQTTLGSIRFTVQGVPCVLTARSSDATGNNFLHIHIRTSEPVTLLTFLYRFHPS